MATAACAFCSGAQLHFSGQSIRAGGVRRRPKQGGRRQQRGRGGDLAAQLGWVVRQDAEFLAKVLEPAAAPLRRLGHRVSRVLEYLFWFRFLENEAAAQWTPSSWPSPSYPDLAGMDLLSADTQALRSYTKYVLHLLKAFSIPLPEFYDQKTIEYYFNCRPHILAARIFEVLFSFGTAAVQMRVSRDMFDDPNIEEFDEAEPSEDITGKLLKETMLNLGPTFIKVGQSLSTRPDIIGPGVAKALSELHDRVPPFPRSIAMKIIEDELGCPADHSFSYISDKTVAAASFGQVYRGCTHDGYDVAIKVQRPDLLHTVHLDIYLLRIGLGIFQKIAKRKSDPCLYADELGKAFVGELDYRLEASNAIEFKEAHASYPFIDVPSIVKHLTRKRVLTMAWLTGENPRDLLSLSKFARIETRNDLKQMDARKRILDFVNIGVEATLVQLLDTGLLHADPHPGNLLFTPEGKLGFLDFGLLSRMEKKHKVAMLAAIVHIVNGDWTALVQDLAEMDVVPPDANTQRFTRDLEHALGVVSIKDGIPDAKFSKILGKIWSIAYGYNFRMPPYFILILRSLASFEGLAVASDQDFKSFQAAYPFVVRKLLYENSSASRRILYSVIFNKKREFQWQRISLLLNLSSSSKSAVTSVTIHTTPSDIHQKDASFDALVRILKLLPSKDGVVLRRILMDGDAKSFVRAMVSDEAIGVRRHISRALADVIYRWMTGVMTRQGILAKNGEGGLTVDTNYTFSESISPHLSATIKDRRVKVILYRMISIVRRNPMLMIRLCWAAVLVSVSSSALALHRLLANLSIEYGNSNLPPSKKLSSLAA